jgi:hypothetical protein
MLSMVQQQLVPLHDRTTRGSTNSTSVADSADAMQL